MFLVFSVYVTIVASQTCGGCEELSFFCINGLHANIEGCGVGDGCLCGCKCACANNTECNDGLFCKFPKSPLTGLFEETTACVEPDFEGRAWDEPAKSMVWLPIVIVIVVLILLVVAYMVWKKKNSGEAKEEAAAEEAKETEPLNEQNV